VKINKFLWKFILKIFWNILQTPGESFPFEEIFLCQRAEFRAVEVTRVPVYHEMEVTEYPVIKVYLKIICLKAKQTF
jgi:hypothetical protein